MSEQNPITEVNISRRKILIGGIGMVAAMASQSQHLQLQPSLQALLLRRATNKENVT